MHLMLKKGSDDEHFELLARYRARFDLPNQDGVAAVEIMFRERDPRFRTLASVHQLKAAPRRDVSVEIRGSLSPELHSGHQWPCRGREWAS